MAIEHIISKIQQDAKKKTDHIIQDAEKEAETLRVQIRQQADDEANRIIEQANKEAQQKKQITIAQVNQEMKRKITAEQEEVITTCFATAQEHLSKLSGKEYSDVVKRLIEQGKQQLGQDCTVYTTRGEDEALATSLGVKVSGSANASGGVLLRSAKGTISLDNTFEGILRRKKDSMRIVIGKLLFSTNSKE